MYTFAKVPSYGRRRRHGAFPMQPTNDLAAVSLRQHAAASTAATCRATEPYARHETRPLPLSIHCWIDPHGSQFPQDDLTSAGNTQDHACMASLTIPRTTIVARRLAPIPRPTLQALYWRSRRCVANGSSAPNLIDIKQDHIIRVCRLSCRGQLPPPAKQHRAPAIPASPDERGCAAFQAHLTCERGLR